MKYFVIFYLVLAVFVTGLIFKSEHYLEGTLAIIGICASLIIYFISQKKAEIFSLVAFQKNFPESISSSTFLITCPYCNHDQQCLHRSQTMTVGLNPIPQSTFDVICAKCDRLLYLEHSDRFYSTLEIAELNKPHQHRCGFR